MKHIADVSELQDFEYCNRHSAGASYVRALEGSIKVSFEDVKDVLNFLKMTFRGFDDEFKGIFTRWKYVDTHFSDWFIRDYLNTGDFEGLDKLLDTNEIELYSRMCYSIRISKYNSKYSVQVDTFAHIILLEGTIKWLDEEQLKLMIARKINAIHKH